MPNERPTAALLYDFDKTLCTTDMQEYTFIPKVGMKPADFWAEADRLKNEKKMDSVLAYLWVMLDESHRSHQSIRRENFVELGRDLKFFPGVSSWFSRINRYGASLGLDVQHYIISSGLKEIIEGSDLSSAFHEIYACEFLYDENGVACWPKNVVNYTTKTQFLFRINKGVLDISEDDELNRYTAEEERAVPFPNMIYFGDGLTDVPCMKLVRSYGGHSIAVFGDSPSPEVKSLIRDGRVDFIYPADYRENSDLDRTVRQVLKGIAVGDMLRRKTLQQKKGAEP